MIEQIACLGLLKYDVFKVNEIRLIFIWGNS